MKHKENISRFTVGIDDETLSKLLKRAELEDRKPAAMIAVLAKRALNEESQPQ